MKRKILGILVCTIMFISFLPATEPIFIEQAQPPMPGDLEGYQLPNISSPEKPMDFYIPGVEPVSVDSNIVSLIGKLDESLYLNYLEGLVSFGPRETSTSACDHAGVYIYNEFVEMGLETRYQEWETDYEYGKNVEATIPGYDSTSDEVYIVCGHYDSVSGSPGADDDASGVAAAMVIAELMKDYICKNTVKFVAFSGEEQGLIGSDFYAEEAYSNEVNIAGVLNCDMIGYAEDEDDRKYLRVYHEEEDDNPFEWLKDYSIEIAEEYYDFIGLEIIPSGYTWASDHYRFWERGYSAIFYAESNFNKYYHSPEDTIENMDLSYAVKNTKLILATLAELAEIQEQQAPFKPVISGETNGKIGQEYFYIVSTDDPQKDELYYLINWDDGTDSGWLGPYESGEEVQIAHIWDKRGTYSIKAKAKDSNDTESDWSDPLSVSMPRYKSIKKQLLFTIHNLLEFFPGLGQLLKI